MHFIAFPILHQFTPLAGLPTFYRANITQSHASWLEANMPPALCRGVFHRADGRQPRSVLSSGASPTMRRRAIST